MSPALGRSAPATMLMSVDLPAPFSPNRTWTSPDLRSKSTRSSACTPGNHLLTPRRRRSGGASARTSEAPQTCTSVDATPGPQSTLKVDLKSGGASDDSEWNELMLEVSV